MTEGTDMTQQNPEVMHAEDGDYVRCQACGSWQPIEQTTLPLPADGDAAWWPDDASHRSGYADWHAGNCAWILSHRYGAEANA